MFGTATTSSANQYNNQASSQYGNTAPNQYTNQYSSMNGSSQPMVNSYNTPVMSQASMGAVANKGPLAHKYGSQYVQPTAPAVSSYNNASNYQANILQPAASYPQDSQNYNTQPGYYGGTPYNPQSSGTSTPLNPSTGAYNQQPQNPIANTQPHMSSFMDVKPETAWNDPPMVKSKEKPKQAQYDTPAPITTPIFGSQSVQQPADQGPPGAPTGSYGNYYSPQDYPAPEPQKAQSAPEPPKAPVVKAPIPTEHQILQDIFAALVQNCQIAATNPQMKRKLDDVTKKLELLYDRLRNNSLSDAVTLGLHQIVQAIQQYDYNTGLSVYTQMVSQGNFSEISSFMPGLKMLIQTAATLQVYVQAAR